jgi:hypothetical protein
MPAIPNNPPVLAIQSIDDIFNFVIDALTGGDPANYYYDRITTGAKELPAEIGAPWIAFEATGETDFQSSTIGDPGDGTQLIGSHSMTFIVHCLGESYGDATALANGVWTALQEAVDDQRPQVEGGTWEPGEHATSGYMLVRHFKVVGLEIPAVKLPLQYPLTGQAKQSVTIKNPVIAPPADDMSTGITYQVTSP